MLLSFSQRRPTKLLGASVDLQSRGLSLLGTLVLDTPQPGESVSVLPREPRHIPHPRVAQQERVAVDHGEAHPPPHKSAQLTVVPLHFSAKRWAVRFSKACASLSAILSTE